MHGTPKPHGDARLRRHAGGGARLRRRIAGPSRAFSSGRSTTSRPRSIAINRTSGRNQIIGDAGNVLGDLCRCSRRRRRSRIQGVVAGDANGVAQSLSYPKTSESSCPQFAIQRAVRELPRGPRVYIQHRGVPAPRCGRGPQFFGFERRRWMTSGGMGTLGRWAMPRRRSARFGIQQPRDRHCGRFASVCRWTSARNVGGGSA